MRKGFRMAPHNVDLDEVEEVEGVEVQPEGEEEVERPSVQEKTIAWVKFAAPKLPPSAHLVPPQALTMATPLRDTTPVDVLFRKFSKDPHGHLSECSCPRLR